MPVLQHLNKGKIHAKLWLGDLESSAFDQVVNLTNLPFAFHHVAKETHFGEEVFVHRKGAVRAYEGRLVIIPGSQGTKSFIAKGLGNPDSFLSCSHGAGRKLSRSAAKKSLDLEEQKAIMDSLGVVHGICSASDLDESPGAYKDISQVMENQNDLVAPLVTLTPIGVVKG